MILMRTLSASLICLFLFQVSMAQSSWNQLNDFAGEGRHHPVLFTIRDSVYLTTGLLESDRLSADFYKYDIANDTWIKKDTFPAQPRSYAVGLTYQDKGYVGFGAGEDDYLKDLWEFDAKTQQWTQLADCPAPGRAHPAFCALNDKIYMGLGNNQNGNRDDWWEYNISTDEWLPKAKFPGEVRHHPFYFTIGEFVYVGLGHGNGIFKDFYRYDSENDSWTRVADIPSYGRVAGTCLSYNGVGFVMAGQNDWHLTPDTNQVWRYIPNTDEWKEGPHIPTGGRWAPGSFIHKNKMYFGFGEALDFSLAKDIWSINLEVLVGIDKLENEIEDKELIINQAGGVTAVKFYEAKDRKVLLYSINGKLLEEGYVSSHDYSFDHTGYKTGIYLLQIQENGSTYYKKIILK